MRDGACCLLLNDNISWLKVAPRDAIVRALGDAWDNVRFLLAVTYWHVSWNHPDYDIGAWNSGTFVLTY